MAPPKGAAQNTANKTRRLVIGFFVLILVDVLWVASSELTKYLFNEQKFNRPFFTTYAKTCMFTIYLMGFMFHRPWRDQCLHSVPETAYEERHTELLPTVLSDPEFEPIQPCSDCESDIGSLMSETDMQVVKEEAENPPDPCPSPGSRGVRFSKTQEVRRLPESEAQAATLSRLPYELWMRAQKLVHQYQNRLPIRKVAKLSLQFSFVWFFGNFAYQEALNWTEAGVVNVLSASSSLFTLVLAGLLPSCPTDRFTLSKLCAVLLSISGVVIVTWVDGGSIEMGVPSGAIWALLGAISYATYLVLLRRRVDSEDKLDIPMFFGFVGLFCLVLMWPGMYILHISEVETFYPLPNKTQLLYITVNGLIGTVLSEYLWLWGCFLTSSLIATMSISLTIPMTVLADRILWKEDYPWSFYGGMLPILLSFFFATLLAHYDNWDPVYVGMRRVVQKVLHFPCLFLRSCRRKAPVRVRDMDREQTESLING